MVSPTTLGVYLGHLHPLLVKVLIRGGAEPLVNAPILLYPFLIFSVSFLIYVLAFVLEKGRNTLFKRLGFHRGLAWVDTTFPFEE